MSPDGSEIEFQDAVSDGAPFSRTGTAAGACTIVAAPSSRGRVFYARDGSGATYVLDQPFTENGLGKYVFSNVIGTMGPNGNLMFPNGVLYRINNGLVEWIRDRNGNVTRFTLATTPDRRVVGITDPLGRYVEICYSGNGCGLADPTPEPSKIYDRILYYGAQGARQEIRVYKDSLENLLCTGALPACPGAGAGKAVAVDTLFPLAERGGLALPTPLNYHNPSDVTAGVKLANGKMYQFTYNGYQELARVTLPTGGAVEYDWGPGQYVGCAFGCASPSGFFGGVRGIVLRGVIERREKDKNGSLTLKRQFQWSNASERKVVSTDGGTGAVLKEEVHLFFGHPLTAGSMESWGYAGWMEGKEYQTDWFNGSTLIRRSLQTWEQRAPVTWWTGSGQTAVNAPSNDPRVTRTDTLSVGLSRVDSTTKGRWIRQSIGYGDSSNRYNNVVDVEDTDYGNEVVAYTTPSPSATVLRKMHFD
jgi:YD repeat-containing protein